jgi:thiosulfate reductase cytochrome b subunit
MGGFEGAALVHRSCAVLMGVVFVAHIFQFLWRGLGQGSLLTVLWGPNSLVPQWKDVTDIYEHVKFFLGKGPRPKFDRYTYWEKFDYMAVFWGMFIIGGSGLLLWFAEELSPWLPGWVFNVATLVHGHEALLAVGFIFTIHFFNGHLRPEKFPMDMVIFTGRLTEHELREERPLEYERLKREGRLAAIEDTPPSAGAVAFGRLVGGTALVLGLVTVVLILYGLFTG